MVSVCQSDSPLHQNLTKHKYRRDLEIRVKLWFLLQQHRPGCHCWPGSVTQTNLFLPGLIIYSVLCEKQGFVIYIITDFFMSVSKNKWRRSFEGLGLKVFCQVSSASLPINSGVNIKTCWRIMMSSSLKICESRRHVRPLAAEPSCLAGPQKLVLPEIKHCNLSDSAAVCFKHVSRTVGWRQRHQIEEQNRWGVDVESVLTLQSCLWSWNLL